VRIGYDMHYAQSALAHAGIGNYSFNLLSHLQEHPDITMIPFQPTEHNMNQQQYLAALTRFIQSSQIDIFHLTSPMSMPYPSIWFSGDLPAIRTIATVYDLIPLHYPDRYLTTAALHTHYQQSLQVLRNTDHLLAISEFTRLDLLQNGFDSARVTTIGTGRDEGYFPLPNLSLSNFSNAFSISDPFILAISAHDFRKNADRLIQGFGLSVARQDRAWQLVFAGDTSPALQQHLIGIAQRSGVGGQVHFVGHVNNSELLRLYNGAAIFAMPSLHEGWGMPVLEAMQCGTPVLIANQTALPEVVGHAAIQVNPTDVNSIAAGLNTLIVNPALRAALGSQGLQRAQEFDWNQVANRTVAVYETVLQQQPRVVPVEKMQGSTVQLALQPNRLRRLALTPGKPRVLTYVSFNLNRVPVDATIKSAVLQIPVQNPRGGIQIHKVATGWSVRSAIQRRPRIFRRAVFRGKRFVKTSRGYLYKWNCTKLARDWQRRQLRNHGVFFRKRTSGTPTLLVTYQL
jgi:glycosyltransferase involved in cell wall biosynthesis